jgi:hypothetical protein
MSTSQRYREHVDALLVMAEAGDDFAAKSLACLALICEGWRYGDPDPVDPPPDGGSEVIDMAPWLAQRAA